MDALVGGVIYFCRIMCGDIDCFSFYQRGIAGKLNAFCLDHIYYCDVFINDRLALFSKGNHSGLQRKNILQPSKAVTLILHREQNAIRTSA